MLRPVSSTPSSAPASTSGIAVWKIVAAGALVLAASVAGWATIGYFAGLGFRAVAGCG